MDVFFSSSFQVFNAVMSLTLLAAVGYGVTRWWRIDDKGIDLFVRLLIDVIVPAYMFYALAKDFNFARLGHYTVPVAAAVLIVMSATALSYSLGFFSGLRGEKLTTTAVICTFGNNLFIPLPLALTLLPEAGAEVGVFYIGLMLLVFGPLSWTMRVWMIQKHSAKRDGGGNGNGRSEFWKTVFNMPTVGTLLGIVAAIPPVREVLFHMQFLTSSLEMLGSAITPLSMFVLGALLTKFTFNTGLSLRILGISLIVKLILLPVFALMALLLFPLDDSILGLIIILETATPPGVTSVVVGRRYKGRIGDISLAVVILTLISILTIPLFVGLYYSLAGG